MDKFRIVGGKALRGTVQISGAKNSALPCLAASLLTSGTVTLKNVPYVRDLITMRRLLEDLGATVLVPELWTHRINAGTVENYEAPYELVKTMRASVLVLGPLVARFGEARVSLPGGCAIGQRPIDLHLLALEKLGATVEMRNGAIEAKASKLRGADINFETVTVTGTENVMMAAVLAEGTTRIFNAACEPEITDLAELLTKMGAKIEGAGTPVLTINGVEYLKGVEHSIIPDRIETGTFLVAAAITRGELEITHCNPDHLVAVIDKLRSAGVHIEQLDATTLRVAGDGKLIAKDITTAVHPGFPTDMQAQYMTLMTQAEGDSLITETIFENRFMHASELQRLGARIRVRGQLASVHGPAPLTGAQLIASDLRASASLVLAGLAAEGETWIDRVYHIDRGYEKIEEKLRAVGAEIERVKS
ncbi:MAG TPA: UDP-N-acetylglucosamine 1-carboxyvinyltransferase [Blastocatellia bacterium]|nr:UDP-N-acetylglucosamine 1-carboxyvinyltransferase [Blastocatellia bacterium]HMV85502.1 UDP-N-acetylglucosamine 1-carboxyvinyltransferase [Blastocatellia bacterium]HMY70314.1 UDP-N-acetylglucosamine 1-carboxyvinyltransferase [Blastocatellia bacterium]HMZ19987.1 UDP-N-acetylglucosamine 1-carboxyvinyltransferase [Blastocatellia bacterium]HNG32331.1 UDP-N-acetylglucosamine 1-carboxyvinyltransferase [Blastocatellia bacterium]